MYLTMKTNMRVTGVDLFFPVAVALARKMVI